MQSTRVFWRREPAGHVAPAAARLPGHVEQAGAPWLEKEPWPHGLHTADLAVVALQAAPAVQ